jgi:hypothetical protein
MAYHNPEIPGSSFDTEEDATKKPEPKKPVAKDK